MKKLLTTLTLLACSTAMAQATTEVPAVTPIVSKITLSEDVTFWGKQTLDTVTEVDTTVAGKAYDMLGWHITVPVYSQDVTGYGAIDRQKKTKEIVQILLQIKIIIVGPSCST